MRSCRRGGGAGAPLEGRLEIPEEIEDEYRAGCDVLEVVRLCEEGEARRAGLAFDDPREIAERGEEIDEEAEHCSKRKFSTCGMSRSMNSGVKLMDMQIGLAYCFLPCIR